MESSVLSKRISNIDRGIGIRRLVSSFLSANNEKGSFGSFRVPKSFQDEFGKQLHSTVVLRSGMSEWKGKYDSDLRKIYVLTKFMKYHGIKVYNLVQFDYYGEDTFIVTIFRDSAIECNYPRIDVKTFLGTGQIIKWNKEEYVLDESSLEYQKSCALWFFNAYHNYEESFEINITNSAVDPQVSTLSLNTDMEKLYKNWEDGTEVSLKLFHKSWEIGIQRIEGRCMFSKGWKAFASEMRLDVGDTLLLFKVEESQPNIIDICLFKGEDKIDEKNQAYGEWKRSFFKFCSETCLNDGIIVVPKMISDMHGNFLSTVKDIKIAGFRSSISYNEFGGYLFNLGTAFEHFGIKPRETIIFTMDKSNVLCGRIYQVDGKEIDYSNRSLLIHNDGSQNWFWKVDWNDENDLKERSANEAEDTQDYKDAAGVISQTLIEVSRGGQTSGTHIDNQVLELVEQNAMDMDIQEVNDMPPEFSVSLCSSNVDNSSHGVYIPRTITPRNRDWHVGEKVTFRNVVGSWRIGVVKFNGRARFSAGWNKFTEDNKLEKNQKLIFTLIEEQEDLVFNVQKI